MRRITALTSDGKPTIKDDDHFDEVEIDDTITLQAALESLFTAQSNLGEMDNWTVRALVKGAFVQVSLDIAAALFPDVVIYRKGG